MIDTLPSIPGATRLKLKVLRTNYLPATPALNSRGDPVETRSEETLVLTAKILPSIPGATRLKHALFDFRLRKALGALPSIPGATRLKHL